MLISCQKQFVPKIRNGEKLLTIRRNRKDGYIPVPGKTKAHLYENSRTPQMRLVLDPPPMIKFHYKIYISRQSAGNIYVSSIYFFRELQLDYLLRCPDCEYITQMEDIDHLHRFAILDGHENFWEMLKFFKIKRGDHFEGNIIGW